MKTILAAGAIFLASGSVEAATVIYSFSGSITSGHDDLAIFGDTIDLSGKSYNLVFSFDDSKGAYNGSTPLSFNQYGNQDNTPISFSLNIGGKDFSPQILGNTNGYLASSRPIAESDFSSGDPYAFSWFSYSTNGNESVQVLFGPYFDFGAFSYARNNEYSYANFARPDRLTISSPTTPSPVPEPAQWFTMLAGFGVIGAFARRRTGYRETVRLN